MQHPVCMEIVSQLCPLWWLLVRKSHLRWKHYAYRWLCIQMIMHTDDYAYRWLCIQMIMHTDDYAYRWLCIQMIMHESPNLTTNLKASARFGDENLTTNLTTFYCLMTTDWVLYTRNVGGCYIWRIWKYHNLAKIWFGDIIGRKWVVLIFFSFGDY